MSTVSARLIGSVCGLAFVLAACNVSNEPVSSTPVDASVDVSLDAAPTLGAADGGLAPDVQTHADAGVDADSGQAPVPERVLFVGNSYTNANNLSAVVRDLSGGAVTTEAITVGGARLGSHWLTEQTRDRVTSGAYDVVVLQGQSLEPVQYPEDFLLNAERFASAITSSVTRTVWFATWARRAGHSIYGSFGGDPEAMTTTLELRYQQAAEFDDGTLARVGAAWQIARAELPDVALHTSDGSHPTAAGTLLAGCVILQAITGQTPRVPDVVPLDIPEDIADALCAIAPRVLGPPPPGCFNVRELLCNETCIDPRWSPEHCGVCNTLCAGEDPCRFGVCGCDPGLTGCARSCVDLQSSTRHCGACGVPCTPGAQCGDGACFCPPASPIPIDFVDLSTVSAGCSSWEAGNVDCNTAAHAHCATLDCFNTGFGPPGGHAPMISSLMCVQAVVTSTTYSGLSGLVAECDGVNERIGQGCTTAISRYCASTGAITGFGPIDNAGDDLTVACLSDGSVVSTTIDDLSMHASRCTPDPVTCSIASWNFCDAMGYAGGFGPIEVAGNDRQVVCFDR